MAKVLLPDELWSLIAAHLPARPPSPKGGRPRIGDRATLTGILFVLRTGISWEYLPRELGCGSGMTCWRRLHEWMQAGVWQSIHEAILRRLREYDQIVWDRACIDAASVPSPRGGEHTGRNPTDRGKLGCKHHVLVDQRGFGFLRPIQYGQLAGGACCRERLVAILDIDGRGIAFGDQLKAQVVRRLHHTAVFRFRPVSERITSMS